MLIIAVSRMPTPPKPSQTPCLHNCCSSQMPFSLLKLRAYLCHASAWVAGKHLCRYPSAAAVWQPLAASFSWSREVEGQRPPLTLATAGSSGPSLPASGQNVWLIHKSRTALERSGTCSARPRGWPHHRLSVQPCLESPVSAASIRTASPRIGLMLQHARSVCSPLPDDIIRPATAVATPSRALAYSEPRHPDTIIEPHPPQSPAAALHLHPRAHVPPRYSAQLVCWPRQALNSGTAWYLAGVLPLCVLPAPHHCTSAEEALPRGEFGSRLCLLEGTLRWLT